MKNDISSLELHYLINELKVVEGSKIDRIYNPKTNPKEITISCHISGSGKTLLKILLPGIIFLDDKKDPADSSTGFGMMLRKYLEGARIRLIEQKDFERVVTMSIESKVGEQINKYFIIIEMFSKGNVIFCDEGFKILNVLEEQHWKERAITRGEVYKYPQARINTLQCTLEEFRSAIESSGKESLVKALAIVFNLGGVFSEELCLLAGVDKGKDIKQVSDDEYQHLFKGLYLLLHKESSAIECDGNIHPFMLESCKGKEKKEYASFSDAIRENYDIIKHTESKKDSNKNVEKIQNIIDDQLKVLRECEENYRENQSKGELIYEKYGEIDAIMKVIKEARTKHSWSAIRQKLNDNPQFKKIIKDIDEKNNSIIINIESDQERA